MHLQLKVATFLAKSIQWQRADTTQIEVLMIFVFTFGDAYRTIAYCITYTYVYHANNSMRITSYILCEKALKICGPNPKNTGPACLTVATVINA